MIGTKALTRLETVSGTFVYFPLAFYKLDVFKGLEERYNSLLRQFGMQAGAEYEELVQPST